MMDSGRYSMNNTPRKGMTADEQIAEAKHRALQYAESLRLAREQEAKALKSLEAQQTKWLQDNEVKNVKIEQLERELESAVDMLHVQRQLADNAQHLNTTANLQPRGFVTSPNSSQLWSAIPQLSQADIHNDLRRVVGGNSGYVAEQVHGTNSGLHTTTTTIAPVDISGYALRPEASNPMIEKSSEAQSLVWNELLNKYKEQLQQSRAEGVSLVKEKRLLTEKALDLSTTISKLQGDKDHLKVKVSDLESKLQFRCNQVKDLELTKTQHEETISMQTQRLSQLQTQLDNRFAQLSSVKQELEVALSRNDTLQAQLALSKEQYASLEAKVEVSKTVIAEKDSVIRDYEHRLKETEDKHTAELLSLKHSVNELQFQLTKSSIQHMQRSDGIAAIPLHEEHDEAYRTTEQQRRDLFPAEHSIAMADDNSESQCSLPSILDAQASVAIPATKGMDSISFLSNTPNKGSTGKRASNKSTPDFGVQRSQHQDQLHQQMGFHRVDSEDNVPLSRSKSADGAVKRVVVRVASRDQQQPSPAGHTSMTPVVRSEHTTKKSSVTSTEKRKSVTPHAKATPVHVPKSVGGTATTTTPHGQSTSAMRSKSATPSTPVTTPAVKGRLVAMVTPKTALKSTPSAVKRKN